MKQKILIRVSMHDDKTRAKAMKKAAGFSGVQSVALKGDGKNQIEVTGEEVDAIALTQLLRKKVAFAELVSVTKVEPPEKPGEKKLTEKKPDDKKPDDKNPQDKRLCCYCQWPHGYGMPCYPYQIYVAEPAYFHQEPTCTIM